MGDYGGPSWSYSPDWDSYLSESGAWDDPDILTVDVNVGNNDWMYEIHLSLFNGSVTSHEGMLVFDVKFDGWCMEMPVKISVPVWSRSYWEEEGHDPKDKKFFEPYFEQNWEVEIERENYKELIDLMGVVSDEWSDDDNTVEFKWRERKAESGSYFRGKPSWDKSEGDVMYFQLAGNIREMIANRLETELKFMFQGYPESI